jgi:RimJ/RimL family protein N-acetyltransferase
MEGARADLRRDRVISLLRPENIASVRVAERLGAVLDGTVEFYNRPINVYAYPRECDAPGAALR